MPFIKGKSGNPTGRPKGAKGRATLLKEERRAIFDERISQRWEKTIDKLKPEYVADQFMGPAPTKHEHTLNWKPFDELPKNDSLPKNKGNPEKNQDNPGRNGSGKNSGDSNVSNNQSSNGQRTEPNQRGFREFSAP